MNHFLNCLRQTCWIFLFPLMLIVCFFLTWLFWSSQNFLYEVWYDHTELKEFIDYYAPQNKLKPEFSQTDREERIRLFNEILVSINSNGSGLDQIQFFSPNDERLGNLLTKSEINHLLEVSRLVTVFKTVSWVSIVIFIASLFFIYFKKTRKRLDTKKIALTYIFVFVVFFILLFLIGPLSVFEILHEFVFPEGHQWFFYYQDSLMTTLMMAPTLFMYFAVLWSLSSLILFFIMLFVIRKVVD